MSASTEKCTSLFGYVYNSTSIFKRKLSVWQVHELCSHAHRCVIADKKDQCISKNTCKIAYFKAQKSFNHIQLLIILP
jgi:hypothetical protein